VHFEMSTDYGIYLHGDVAVERKELIRRKLVEFADLKEPSVILDVGCGRGLVAIAFSANCSRHRVFAIDIWNEEEIPDNSPEWVRRNARAEGVENVTVATGDARRIPYEDEFFDVVVSNLVVHNLEVADQEVALAEMARVLKPAGLFIYSDVDIADQFVRVKAWLGSAGFEAIDLRHVLTFPTSRVSVNAVMARKPHKGDEVAC